jgi:hypothetical protein
LVNSEKKRQITITKWGREREKKILTELADKVKQKEHHEAAEKANQRASEFVEKVRSNQFLQEQIRAQKVPFHASGRWKVWIGVRGIASLTRGFAFGGFLGNKLRIWKKIKKRNPQKSITSSERMND